MNPFSILKKKSSLRSMLFILKREDSKETGVAGPPKNRVRGGEAGRLRLGLRSDLC